MRLKVKWDKLQSLAAEKIATVPTQQVTTGDQALTWLSSELGLNEATIKKALLTRNPRNDFETG